MKTNQKTKFGERVKNRRLELGISQAELSRRAGYTSRSTIGKIEGGESDVSRDKIVSLAKALQTTPAYLMGWDDAKSKAFEYANVYPVEPYTKLPVLGIIRAGQPVCCDQNNYGEWEFADAKYGDGQHFMLRVQGDSMSPTIPDGSMAIIRIQDTAEKGQIVAFAMDGEYATLKRYYPQSNGTILLRADNPLADSYTITQEQLNNKEAFILGVCRSYKVNL